MLTAEDFRALALSLPGTVEAPHHGFPSFRVTGRIFATLPDPGHAHVMATEAAIRAAAQMHPACCSEYWWGKRLACVRIAFAAAPAALVEELLDDAWNKKATQPRRR